MLRAFISENGTQAQRLTGICRIKASISIFSWMLRQALYLEAIGTIVALGWTKWERVLKLATRDYQPHLATGHLFN